MSNSRKAEKKQVSYAGIPASEREGLAVYMAVRNTRGWNLTPQAAYAELVKSRERDEQKKADKNAKRERLMRRDSRERARDAIAPSIGRLGDVRDFLEQMEEDSTPAGMDSQVAAGFAKAFLSQTVCTLEQALFDLGMITGHEYEWAIEGEFVEILRRK